MKQTLFLICVIVTSMFFTTAHAVDPEDSLESDYYSDSNIHEQFGKARTLIGRADYKSAIRELNAIIRDDTRNADAWNLIGYANRKLGKLAEARAAYGKALTYEPNHKGALEYQGQLFIKLNDMKNAHANRDRLATLCPSGCDELDKLSEAIAAAK